MSTDIDEMFAATSAGASVAAAMSSIAEAAPSPFTTLQLQLSQALGLTVSAGSALVKLPQLIALVRSGSTVGVSLSMYSLELFSQSVAVYYHRAYGFPVATYGENLTLGAGNVAVLAAFAAINRDPRALVSLAFPILIAPLVHYPGLLALLQSLSIPLNIAAKLPQILINQQLLAILQERAKAMRKLLEAMRIAAASSGGIVTSAAATAACCAPLPQSSLSALPFALNLGGSVSRLFTTFAQLGGDRVMLMGFIVSCALNAAILVQCAQIKACQKECSQLQLQIKNNMATAAPKAS